MSNEVAERPENNAIAQMSEAELSTLIESYTVRVEQLQESLATQVQMAYDNLGWQPMGAAYNGTRHGPSLQAIKDISCVGEQVATANPLAKRGINVRSSYIWGQGASLKRVPKRGRDVRSIARTIGTTEAQLEIERTLAATGNLFFEVSRRSSLRLIPICDITDALADTEDPSVLTYIQVAYDDYTRDEALDLETQLDRGRFPAGIRREWVPTIEQSGVLRTMINGIEVNPNKRIKHLGVNKESNWWWGIPDLYAVIMWIKGYKEYLEDNKTLTKAYAQFAWKVSANSRRGGERVASRMAQAPSQDPLTGEMTNVGAAAILGRDQDMAPLQSVRSVDFDNGRPLAAMVAAGLDLPLQVLISDAAAGGSRRTDESLDSATALTLGARQAVMDSTLNDVAELLGLSSFNIEWPEINPEPTHRVVQALDMAGRSGMLYPKEWRQGLGRALAMNLTGDAPDADQLPVLLQPSAAPDASVEEEGPSGDAPAQIEPPSYGDHELRDEGYQDHTSQS